jgi:hypothetical protein
MSCCDFGFVLARELAEEAERRRIGGGVELAPTLAATEREPGLSALLFCQGWWARLRAARPGQR